MKSTTANPLETLLPIGSVVLVSLPGQLRSTLYGLIASHVIVHSQLLYVVDLGKNGFWSEDKSTFVRLMLAASDVVSEVTA